MSGTDNTNDLEKGDTIVTEVAGNSENNNNGEDVEAIVLSVMDKPKNESARVIVPWNLCHVDRAITDGDAREVWDRYLQKYPFEDVKKLIKRMLVKKRAVSLFVFFYITRICLCTMLLTLYCC